MKILHPTSEAPLVRLLHEPGVTVVGHILIELPAELISKEEMFVLASSLPQFYPEKDCRSRGGLVAVAVPEISPGVAPNI